MEYSGLRLVKRPETGGMEIVGRDKNYPLGVVDTADLPEHEVEQWWALIRESVTPAVRSGRGALYIHLPNSETPEELKTILVDMFTKVNNGGNGIGHREALVALEIIGNHYGEEHEFSELAVNEYTKAFFDGSDGLLEKISGSSGASFTNQKWTLGRTLLVLRFIVCGKPIPGIPHDKLYERLVRAVDKGDRAFAFYTADQINDHKAGYKNISW